MSGVSAEFVEVAHTDELSPGQMKRVQVQGQRLLLCRTEEGWYCVDEMCSHEDYSLYFGCIKGRAIKCSLHGSHFDLATGAPLNDPADAPIRTYPVRIEGERVCVRV
ncbi:MAG: non-heme iron oxygenase ferredoxin subunit [Thiobacillaceae bacterium]|nr:non-heme iron oxygenase ferredoxin subunit [Thiobacillaceae bacterium]MCX7672658.1 non-heme iron oxygenase ferredoxin subunit [Thiobacillaceae bacterium]MDW8323672.1 non-heme iron oxygenase ferredoxin subunit [Burkholderiales bacterium]